MNLKELQVVLDDKLMMSRIYDALLTCGKLNEKECRFLHTEEFPNRHNSIINIHQVEQLKADGYTVTEETNHGSLIHIVSGWNVTK